MAVDMLDAIGANLGLIPKGTKKVATYLTGSGGIMADPSELARLRADDPELELVLRIDQANSVNLFHQVRYLVVDIEPGAATLSVALDVAEGRKKLGLRTALYTFEADMANVQAGVNARGLADVVDYWLAHWGIGRDAAVALLGHPYKAVQYENDAHWDRSVTLADWPNAPAPPAPPKRSQALLTAVEDGKGAKWEVAGVDNPGDVNIPNAEDWNVKVTKHPNGTWSAAPLGAAKATVKRPALKIHPKVKAAGATAVPVAAARVALQALGVHLTPAELDAANVLTPLLPVLAGYLKSSGVTL